MAAHFAQNQGDDDDRRGCFVCVCSEKSVQLSTDCKLERAFQSLAIKRHLESLCSELPHKQFMYLPGAGIAFNSARCHSAVQGYLLSVFAGDLENYAYLVNKYCLAAAKLDASKSWRLEAIRALSPLTNAQVINELYSQMGATFLAKLKGRFQFCLYDAHSGRVLAANDAHATHALWQGHLQEDNSLVVGCSVVPPLGVLVDGRSVAIGAGEYKFGWRSVPLAYRSSQLTSSLKANDAMTAALAALADTVTPRRGTVSLDAVRPAAACKAGAPASLSYVPPHKRAAPVPAGGATRSWRRSTDSAPSAGTPPAPPLAGFVGRSAISMDHPDRSQPYVPPTRSLTRNRSAARLALDAVLAHSDAAAAPPPQLLSATAERCSFPIDIPPKAPVNLPPAAIGKLGLAKLVAPSESEASSPLSARSGQLAFDLLQHQDSRASQLQFSVSSASMATEPGHEGLSGSQPRPPRLAPDHAPVRGAVRPSPLATVTANVFDWPEDVEAPRSEYAATGAWGTLPSSGLAPSIEVLEANRLLQRAAQAALGGDSAPGGAKLPVLGIAAPAVHVSADERTSRRGLSAAGDARFGADATSVAGAELSLAGGISGASCDVSERSWFAPVRSQEHSAGRGTADALPAFGSPLQARLSCVSESPDRSQPILSFSDAFVPLSSRAASTVSSSSLLPTAFAGPGLSPLPGLGRDGSRSPSESGATGSSPGLLSLAGLGTSPPASHAPSELASEPAADPLADAGSAPLVPLGAIGEPCTERSEPSPAAVVPSLSSAQAGALPERAASEEPAVKSDQLAPIKVVETASAALVENASAAPADEQDDVGVSLERLNRAVEEAHMAREVTWLMGQTPPHRVCFPGGRPLLSTAESPAASGKSQPAAAAPEPAKADAAQARASGSGAVPPRPPSPATPGTPADMRGAPPGMGMRAGSFPMALAALLRGRSSPNLLSAMGGSGSHSPAHSSMRARGASPAGPLSPATSSSHLRRLEHIGRSPLSPQLVGDARSPAPALHSSSRALSGYASPLISTTSALGSRTASLASLADSGTVASSPRASLPLGDVIQKLPPDLLDELTGGSEEPEVKAMLANLLYSSPCSLCIVDAVAPGQPIVYVNAIFELQTGYSYEEAIGRNCRFLQAPPNTPHAPTFQSLALKRAIAMGRSHACKMLNFAKDGTPLWNQLAIVPVRTRAGAVSHYVGMQTFTPTHRPSPLAPPSVKARQRSGSFAVLSAFAGECEPAAVQRSSSHAMLLPLGATSTSAHPGMVS